MYKIVRAELLAAQGKPCPYCNRPMVRPTKDHVNPKCRGYTFINNKLVVCDECNNDKGDRSLQGWFVHLRKLPDKSELTIKRIYVINALLARLRNYRN